MLSEGGRGREGREKEGEKGTPARRGSPVGEGDGAKGLQVVRLAGAQSSKVRAMRQEGSTGQVMKGFVGQERSHKDF